MTYCEVSGQPVAAPVQLVGEDKGYALRVPGQTEMHRDHACVPQQGVIVTMD